MTDSTELAEFAASVTAAIAPEAVQAKLKTTLLHNLGMLRAGSGLADPALALADPYNGPDAASVLSDGRKTHPDSAILANAAMMHARTQDDTHLPAITHLAATCLPPLIATAEAQGSSGSEFLDAMLASYEVGSAVASETGPLASARGFRPSSVLGGVASSVGVGRLLGLNEGQIAAAIGLAASFGGGTGQTWVAGTDEWQYQVGNAGRTGLLSANLATKGVASAPDALEGSNGLYQAFAGTQKPHSSSFELGTNWRTLEVTYKPFPVCAINQMPVTILLAMMDQQKFSSEDIDSLELRLSPSEEAYPGTNEFGPFSGASGALMSAPFCLAVAARERTVTRAMVEDFENPVVNKLAGKVTVVSDTNLKAGQSIITVKGQRGEFSSTEIDLPANFDWEFNEVYDRLVAMGDERGMSTTALNGLVGCLAKFEDAAIGDLVAAITAE